MNEAPILTPEQEKEKAELEAQLAALKASPLLQAYPNLGFVPNPPQYRFLQSVNEGVKNGKRIFIAPWGNGVGKSACLANFLGAICMRPEIRCPRWFDFDFINNWKWPKHARIVCDSKQLKEDTGAIWKALRQWWPQAEYITKKQGNEWVSMYKWRVTDWVVDLMTFDQPRLAHESATLGAVFFDEPPPEQIWNAYPSRFRQGGIICMLATMLESDHDISYVDKLLEDPDIVWFHASDHENCNLCGRLELPDGLLITGYLDHAELNRIAARYSEDERDTRTNGLLQRARGKVFDFDVDVHTIARDKIPKNLTTLLALDPHQAKKYFITVGGIDENENWYIVDEWPRETFWSTMRCDTGLKQYAEIIEGLETKWGCVQKVIDQKYASQNQRFDDCAMSLSERFLTKYGLYFEKGVTNPEVEGGGINQLEELLKYDHSKPLGPDNRPKLYVCSDLRNTIDSLRNLRKKRDPNGGYQNKLDPKYLDPARCVMYLVCHDLSYQGNVSGIGNDRPIHGQDQLVVRLQEQGIQPPNDLYEVNRA